MKNISIIIPTYNEEENIAKCIESAKLVADDIYVVDSCSSDKTVEIARGLGAIVYQQKWTIFSEKINWAIENVPIKTDWMMRLDADEVLGDGFAEVWQNCKHEDVVAYSIRRRFVFLQKELKFGGWGGLWDIRIWKPAYVQMETRKIDEHILVDGRLARLEVKVLDDSYKSLPIVYDADNRSRVKFWVEKHNNYSDIEAKEFLESSAVVGRSEVSAKVKRFIKNKVYYKLPLFVRPFLFFFYRYFLLLGFLDGRQGLIVHVLHTFWYRFLVDVKIFERNLLK
jgi:glycosyltransferase involved in cell wall biosynthesis